MFWFVVVCPRKILVLCSGISFIPLFMLTNTKPKHILFCVYEHTFRCKYIHICLYVYTTMFKLLSQERAGENDSKTCHIYSTGNDCCWKVSWVKSCSQSAKVLTKLFLLFL